jgi:hypothetical protein
MAKRKSTKGQTTIYKTSVKSFANIDTQPVFVIYISKAMFILLPVSGEINSAVLPSLKYLYNTTVKIPVDILLEKYLNTGWVCRPNM